MSDAIIGIDLGTTNSMAAWVSATGTEIIENKEESSFTPSMVTLLSDQSLVGTQAREKRLEHPEQTFYSFKRFMGRGGKDIEEDLSKLPFPVSIGERDNLLLGEGSLQCSPEQMSAKVLKSIKEKSERILGESVHRVVVTVPAYFDDGQRQATKDAAQIAGLEVVRMINEPTAAAIAYGLDEKKKGIVAIYDFGGGTFDVSILELKGKIFKVLATNGNTHLGGDDLDHLVMDELLRQILPQESQNYKATSEDKQLLKKTAEQIKIELTSSLEITDFPITLPSLGIETSISIRREDFDQWIQPLVEKTLAHITQAIQDANLGERKIEEVVMVGGTTRVPLVRKMVADYFQLTPHVRINPDQVVAIGAGIQGHLLAGGRRDFLLMDVIPLSLGIETMGGVFSKLIMKNSSLPAQFTEAFSTSVDNQTGVNISIYQGEREFVRDCRLLGKFILKGIPPMPAGLPRVEVSFLVDASGLLTVTAKELRSEVETQIEIIPSHGLKREEVNQMIRDSVEYAIEDFTKRNLVDFRRTAEGILKGLDRTWPSIDSYISKAEQEAILEHRKVLEEHMVKADPRVLKASIDRMGDLTRELADQVMGGAAKEALVEK